MAFRRHWRLKGDVIAFFILMLALMTPAFLVGLGNQLLWKFMGYTPNLWYTALGANVIWGIPFSFLVMLAVWNRYDRHVEEAARDLGANGPTTFREVTLPLVWTGIFGSFLFGFTLTWNDFDRTILLQSGYEAQPLPILIGTWPQSRPILPNLYALGAGTTAVTLALIAVVLIAVTARLRVAARRSRASRRSSAWSRAAGSASTQPTRRGSRRRPARREDGEPARCVPEAYAPRGERFVKSSAISSKVAQRIPSWQLMCSMSRSSMSSTCGRPDTSGWMVNVKTA